MHQFSYRVCLFFSGAPVLISFSSIFVRSTCSHIIFSSVSASEPLLSYRFFCSGGFSEPLCSYRFLLCFRNFYSHIVFLLGRGFRRLCSHIVFDWFILEHLFYFGIVFSGVFIFRA
jgi:hypothetical protein